VAKKKTARKGAARGVRKKSAARRGTPKASRPGAQSPRRVNLKPLQKILTAELSRLEGYERTPEVENTMKLLSDTKTSLTNACLTSRLPMVIEF
jgi:hypothetical protein